MDYSPLTPAQAQLLIDRDGHADDGFTPSLPARSSGCDAGLSLREVEGPGWAHIPASAGSTPAPAIDDIDAHAEAVSILGHAVIYAIFWIVALCALRWAMGQ